MGWGRGVNIKNEDKTSGMSVSVWDGAYLIVVGVGAVRSVREYDGRVRDGVGGGYKIRWS